MILYQLKQQRKNILIWRSRQLILLILLIYINGPDITLYKRNKNLSKWSLKKQTREVLLTFFIFWKRFFFLTQKHVNKENPCREHSRFRTTFCHSNKTFHLFISSGSDSTLKHTQRKTQFQLVGTGLKLKVLNLIWQHLYFIHFGSA